MWFETTKIVSVYFQFWAIELLSHSNLITYICFVSLRYLLVSIVRNIINIVGLNTIIYLLSSISVSKWSARWLKMKIPSLMMTWMIFHMKNIGNCYRPLHPKRSESKLL